MFVCCECCVLSGRGICDELITRPEESYRMWCVVVRDLETSRKRRLWTTGGCRAKNRTKTELVFGLFLIQDTVGVYVMLPCLSMLHYQESISTNNEYF